MGLYRERKHFTSRLERHCVAKRSAFECDGAVVSGYRCQKLRDGFVVPNFGHLNSARNGVAGTNGSAEVPVHMQEDRTRTWQIFGNDRVQNGADDSSLDDNSAETCRLCQLLVVV